MLSPEKQQLVKSEEKIFFVGSYVRFSEKLIWKTTQYNITYNITQHYLFRSLQDKRMLSRAVLALASKCNISKIPLQLEDI